MPTFPNDNPALQAQLKSQLDTQVDVFTQMSRHAVDAAGELGELNLRMMRTLFEDTLRFGRAMAACKDPVQMSAVAMREAQPAAEHWRSWQSELAKVLGAGGAALARDANEGGWQAARGAENFMQAGAGGAAPDGKAAHAPLP